MCIFDEGVTKGMGICSFLMSIGLLLGGGISYAYLNNQCLIYPSECQVESRQIAFTVMLIGGSIGLSVLLLIGTVISCFLAFALSYDYRHRS